jgi:hypothetical protein
VIRAELKHERDEHARATADFNAVLASRQAKLQQLDLAIKGKAGELGAAIVQDLV